MRIQAAAAVRALATHKPATIDAGGPGSGRRPSGSILGKPDQSHLDQKQMHGVLKGYEYVPKSAFQYGPSTSFSYEHAKGHTVDTDGSGSWVHTHSSGNKTYGEGSDELLQHLKNVHGQAR